MVTSFKIAYMAGGADYTIEPLRKIIQSNHKISYVFTKVPKSSRKGKKVNNSQFLSFIKENRLQYDFPNNLSNNNIIRLIRSLKLDFIIVFSYGLILPKQILSIPKYGCINIHASLLPRWRGPSPIQYSLLFGDEVTGYSFMVMEEKVDQGAVFFKEEIQIQENDNSSSLLKKISKGSSEKIVTALELIADNKVKFLVQDEKKVTYSYKIKKNDTYISFDENAFEILCKIRAFNLNPGAKCIIDKEIVKILDAKIEENFTDVKETGIVLDNGLLISCKDKAIRLIKIQREGRKAMLVKEALNGWNISKGIKIYEKK